MSHFTTIATRMVDQDALLAALKDVGYRKVEVHAEPVALMGYQGDERRDRAHVVIRRRHVGLLSNDIGFVRGPDGTYSAIISDFDRRKHSPAWLSRLSQRCAFHATVRSLTKQGFEIVEHAELPDATVSIRLRRLVGT